MTKTATMMRALGAVAIIVPALLAGCSHRAHENGSGATLNSDSAGGTPPQAGVQPNSDIYQNGSGQPTSPRTGVTTPGTPRPER